MSTFCAYHAVMLPRDSFFSIDLKTKENFFFDFDAYSIVNFGPKNFKTQDPHYGVF